MMEALCLKTPSGSLAPADEAAREFIAKLKTMETVRVEIKRVRNLKFHKKMFALFKLAFDAWEPEGVGNEYKGQIIAKDFERFRKDIIIVAGFYKTTVNLRGEVRYEAESLSFGSMSETRFGEVFKAVLNVVWERILKLQGYQDTAHVERIIEELLRFEG
ncbi:MAG: DUF1367 family protein [Betaproteobacteria bacterium]|nr:DUF1367 family protein [Betaproteobacteria bacterium]